MYTYEKLHMFNRLCFMAMRESTLCLPSVLPQKHHRLNLCPCILHSRRFLQKHIEVRAVLQLKFQKNAACLTRHLHLQLHQPGPRCSREDDAELLRYLLTLYLHFTYIAKRLCFSSDTDG